MSQVAPSIPAGARWMGTLSAFRHNHRDHVIDYCFRCNESKEKVMELSDSGVMSLQIPMVALVVVFSISIFLY